MPQRVGGHTHIRPQISFAELVDRELQVYLVRRSVLYDGVFTPKKENLNIRHKYSIDTC